MTEKQPTRASDLLNHIEEKAQRKIRMLTSFRENIRIMLDLSDDQLKIYNREQCPVTDSVYVWLAEMHALLKKHSLTYMREGAYNDDLECYLDCDSDDTKIKTYHEIEKLVEHIGENKIYELYGFMKKRSISKSMYEALVAYRAGDTSLLQKEHETTKIQLTSLEMTCSASPVQYEGNTVDGKYVYIRERNGYLTMEVGGDLIYIYGGDRDIDVWSHVQHVFDVGYMDEQKELGRFEILQEETENLSLPQMIQFYWNKNDKVTAQKLVRLYVAGDLSDDDDYFTEKNVPSGREVLTLYMQYEFPQEEIDECVRQGMFGENEYELGVYNQGIVSDNPQFTIKSNSTLEDVDNFLAEVEKVYGTQITRDEVRTYMISTIQEISTRDVNNFWRATQYIHWIRLFDIEKPDNWEEKVAAYDLYSKCADIYSEKDKRKLTRYVLQLMKQDNTMSQDICIQIADIFIDNEYESEYLMNITIIISFLQRLGIETSRENARTMIYDRLWENLTYRSQIKSQIPAMMEYLGYTQDDLLHDLIHTNLGYNSNDGRYNKKSINLVDNMHALNLKNVVECYGLEDQLDNIVQQHLPYFTKAVYDAVKCSNYHEVLYLIEQYHLEQYPGFAKQKQICEQMNKQEVPVYTNPTPRRLNRETYTIDMIPGGPSEEVKTGFLEKLDVMKETYKVIDLTDDEKNLLQYYKIKREYAMFTDTVTDRLDRGFTEGNYNDIRTAVV